MGPGLFDSYDVVVQVSFGLVGVWNQFNQRDNHEISPTLRPLALSRELLASFRS